MSFDENISINEDENYGIIEINPKIFSLEVIYPAAYTYLDRAYFVFDGDPDDEIRVKVRPKDEDEDLKELVYEIQNELVNYAVYIIQSSRNQEIRNAIIKRALGTNGIEETVDENCQSSGEEDLIGPSEDFEDDMGIAEPWSPDKAEGVNDTADSIEEDEEKEDFSPEDISRARINKEKCIDCGICYNIDSENFVEQDGSIKPDEEQTITEKTVEAKESCPMDAIEFLEE